jgi:hypothetical protein
VTVTFTEHVPALRLFTVVPTSLQFFFEDVATEKLVFDPFGVLSLLRLTKVFDEVDALALITFV